MGIFEKLFKKKESPAFGEEPVPLKSQEPENANHGEKTESAIAGTDGAEQQIAGTWTSYSVIDDMGNDISDIFEPDGLRLTLNPDYTGELNISGEEYTRNNWSFYNNYGSFQNAFDEIDGTKFSLSFELEGNTLIAKYNGEGLYKQYTCSK